MTEDSVSNEEIDTRYHEVIETAKKGRYHINPDEEFARDLVRGLVVNRKRYGYEACPCRLVIGTEEDNTDIICPCDYRDDDLIEYGACYCGLYVNEEIFSGKKELSAIPERRERGPLGKVKTPDVRGAGSMELSYPVYRCNVCGYLCARNDPPERCPICGVDSKRFSIFLK